MRSFTKKMMSIILSALMVFSTFSLFNAIEVAAEPQMGTFAQDYEQSDVYEDFIASADAFSAVLPPNSPYFNNSVLGGSGTVYFDIAAIEEAPEATFLDFLAHSFHFQDTLADFERTTGINVQQLSSDFPDIIISENLMEEARMIIHDFTRQWQGYASIGGFARVGSDGPSQNNVAKATSIDFALASAGESVSRNPSLNLANEAQFMFLSHFVDTMPHHPFWVTGDPNSLSVPSAMEMQRRFLAHRITNDDRTVYRNFMTVTGTAHLLSNLADIANFIASTHSYTVGYFRDGTTRWRKATQDARISRNNIALGMGIVTEKYMQDIEKVWSAVGALQNQFVATFWHDPDASLQLMHNQFLQDEGIWADFPLIDRNFIASLATSLFASFLIKGSFGTIATIPFVFNSIALNFNLLSSFFNSVALIALRNSFSGRHAIRFFEDLIRFSAEDISFEEFQMLDFYEMMHLFEDTELID